MTTMTPDESQRAADLMTRAQPHIGILSLQFSDEDLDLMERSLDAIEEDMAPRQTLAELFGRSSFNQTDQNIKAKLPALRLFIQTLREAKKIGVRSELHVFGQEIWGDE